MVCCGKSYVIYTPFQDLLTDDLPLVACFGSILFGQDIGAISVVLVMQYMKILLSNYRKHEHLTAYKDLRAWAKLPSSTSDTLSVVLALE